jgi:hypothetical protein
MCEPVCDNKFVSFLNVNKVSINCRHLQPSGHQVWKGEYGPRFRKAANPCTRLFLLLRWDETMFLWKWAATMPIIHPQMIYERMWSSGVMILTGENRRTRRKTYPSATLSTTNPTWSNLGTNAGLRND